MDSTHSDAVTAWRSEAGPDHPAGPLFIGGEFAQADLVFADADACTASICTGSCTVLCCAIG